MLTGLDHLLFVLRLLIIVTGRRMLIKTITAFTLAHSLTLAAAFRRPDGRALHVPAAAQAESGQLQIYQAPGINPSPGDGTKLLVRTIKAWSLCLATLRF